MVQPADTAHACRFCRQNRFKVWMSSAVTHGSFQSIPQPFPKHNIDILPTIPSITPTQCQPLVHLIMADFPIYSSAMERTPVIDVADGIKTASTILERQNFSTRL